MHAVLVTFRSAVAPDALAGLFGQYAEALQAVPGLVVGTWLPAGERPAGFHLFAARGAGEEYLASALAARLVAHPAFAARAVRHFAVLGELGHATGTPRPPGA